MAQQQLGRPHGTIDFSVIGEAFTLLFKSWSDYLVMGLVSCLLPLIATAIFFVFYFFSIMSDPVSPDISSMIFLQLSAYVVIYGSMFAAMPCYGGITVYTLKLLRTGHADLSDFWSVWKRAGRWYLLGLILIGWYFLGLLACGLGAIVVTTMLFLTMPIMVHENLSPSEAVRESYYRVKDQFWITLGLLIVTSLIAQIGQFACGIGYVFTFPLYFMIPTMVYAKWLVPRSVATAASPYPRTSRHEYGAPPKAHNIGGEIAPPIIDQDKRDLEQDELSND